MSLHRVFLKNIQDIGLEIFNFIISSWIEIEIGFAPIGDNPYNSFLWSADSVPMKDLQLEGKDNGVS